MHCLSGPTLRYPTKPRSTTVPGHGPAWRALAGAALLAAAALASPAQAQDYPSKPVRFVVPFTPGGGTDIVTRIVAQRLADTWGKPTVVENRPGTGGIIASQAVLAAPPDGYTMNVITPVHAILPSLYSKLSYDPITDFVPVVLMNRLQLIIVSAPGFPPNNIRELIAYGKSHPGQLNFASTGTGGTAHLAMELLKRSAGIEMTHIPYKGSAPAYTDVMSGQVHMLSNNIISTMPLIKAGKLKALAVTGATRSVLAPDVPAVAEAGLAGFDVSSWFGIAAHARTARDIVNRLNRDTVRVLQEPAVRDKMLEQGAEPIAGANSPAEFDQMIRREARIWADTIRSAGIRQEAAPTQ